MQDIKSSLYENDIDLDNDFHRLAEEAEIEYVAESTNISEEEKAVRQEKVQTLTCKLQQAFAENDVETIKSILDETGENKTALVLNKDEKNLAGLLMQAEVRIKEKENSDEVEEKGSSLSRHSIDDEGSESSESASERRLNTMKNAVREAMKNMDLDK